MNARKPFAFLCLALATVLVLSGCLTNSTRQEDPIPGVRQSSFRYADRDGQLVIQIPRRIDPSCSGDVLVYDTLPNTTDSIGFSLAGDTLEWDYRSETVGGATFQHFLRFGRVGSGSGLLGVWRRSRSGYKVVSGELPPNLKASMDSNEIIGNLQDAYVLMHLRVTQDSIDLYMQINSAGLANSNWTNAVPVNDQADSMRWDMDFRIVDTHTVEYHGRKTGETVRVTRFDNDDLEYSSDNPSHPHYHYSDIPETCPDEFEPDWYSSFLSANAKDENPLPKAQIPPNSAKRGYPVATPLKFRGFFLN